MSIYKTLFETQENKMKTGIVGMIIITIMLAGVFRFEASAIDAISEEELNLMTSEMESGVELELVDFEFIDNTNGHTNENSETDFPVTIDYEKLKEVSCTLTWTDEGTSFFRGTNEPDEFQLSIIAPNDEVVAESDLSSTSPISATATLPDFNEEDFVENYVGSWIIRVEAGDCGDDHSRFGLRSTADTGNDWDLEYSYEYKEEVETVTD